MIFDLETVFALAVIGVMLFSVIRQGRNPPDSSGSLFKKHAQLAVKVATIETTIKGLASAADIERVSGKVSALDEKIEGIEVIAEKTDQRTVRIETRLDKILEIALAGRHK